MVLIQAKKHPPSPSQISAKQSPEQALADLYGPKSKGQLKMIYAQTVRKRLEALGFHQKQEPLQYNQAAEYLFSQKSFHALNELEQWVIRREVDGNQDQKVSFAELTTYFVRQDTDKDGFISSAEETLAKDKAGEGYLASQAKQYLFPKTSQELHQRLKTNQVAATPLYFEEGYDLAATGKNNDLNIPRLWNVATHYAEGAKVVSSSVPNARHLKKQLLENVAAKGVMPKVIEDPQTKGIYLQQFNIQSTDLGDQETRYKIAFKLEKLNPRTGQLEIVKENPEWATGTLKDPNAYLGNRSPHFRDPNMDKFETELTQSLQEAMPRLTEMGHEFIKILEMKNPEEALKQNPTFNALVNKIQQIYGIQIKDFHFISKSPPGAPLASYHPDTNKFFVYVQPLVDEIQLMKKGGNIHRSDFAAQRISSMIMSSTAHELLHGYQHAVIQNPESFGLTSNAPQVRDYQKNSIRYNDPVFATAVIGDSGRFYTDQIQEKYAKEIGSLVESLFEGAEGQSPAD